jgi:hypothetical protein
MNGRTHLVDLSYSGLDWTELPQNMGHGCLAYMVMKSDNSHIDDSEGHSLLGCNSF